MEEGLAGGSLSWQGAQGADGRFQVCVLLGTVTLCEYEWLLCCAVVAAALSLTLNTASDRFGPLRDAKHRGQGVTHQSEGYFSAIIELLAGMLHNFQIF